jgi:hypothetical protein
MRVSYLAVGEALPWLLLLPLVITVHIIIKKTLQQ